MNGRNNKFYYTLNTMVDLFLLNLLWVVASLPLITFFPATAALFGVVRKRILKKETEGIFKSFIKMLKENFKQSFILSIIWSVLGIFLLMDYRLIHPGDSVVQLILFIILIIGILLFSMSSIYLFPIMVHFELSWKYVIRNAFFISLMNPVRTVLLMLIVGLGITILYFYPVTIFIICSFIAYAVYYHCHMFFNKLSNLMK
jgi:uncharacterized membrane protein YesL